ncbi:MAG: hypothetical protein JWR29_2052 [Tardiphaga sp.]|nr:hypothetical protein [Tardiphaga sp.]
MAGCGGGIDHRDGRIGAKVARDVEGQLHARRQLCERLIDAEFEIERAIKMPQNDARGDRRHAGMQRDDLALALGGEGCGGATNKSGVTAVQFQRGAAFGFPSAGFEIKKQIEGRGDLVWTAHHLERDLAMLGEAIAQAAQVFQFLRAECVAQDILGVARGIEAGAVMRLQNRWRQFLAGEGGGDGGHRRAVQGRIAQDQRMRAGVPGLCHHLQYRLDRMIAIEQRRTERAVRIGGHECRKQNTEGAAQLDDGNESGQFGCFPFAAPRRQRRHAGAVASAGIDGQRPIRKEITVRLDGARTELPPVSFADHGDGWLHRGAIDMARGCGRCGAHAPQRCHQRVDDIGHVSIPSCKSARASPRARCLRAIRDPRRNFRILG